MGKASCGTAACFMLWARFFLLLATEQTDAASRVQCLNNYGFQGRRVDCQWHRHQALERTLFYLNFSEYSPKFPFDRFPGQTLAWRVFHCRGKQGGMCCVAHFCGKPESRPCAQPKGNSTWVCQCEEGLPENTGHFSCSAYSEEGEFTENDEYKVVLHASSLGENYTDLIFVKYQPRLHIACEPPLDLQSECSDHKCWVHWKRPEAYEEILEDWQWELAFKAVQEPWEQAQRRVFISSETRMHIEGFEFKSDKDYVLRMRCKTPEENPYYGSHWSAWSSCVTWTAHRGDWQQLDAPIYCLLCLGTLLLLLALAFALFKRAQNSCGGSIPTPATFFQPLHLARCEDVKGWAGLAPAEAAAVLSPLSFLQPPSGTGLGPAKWCTWGKELWEGLQEPERLPADYCILGAREGVAPVPATWNAAAPGACSGAPPGSLPLHGQGQAEELLGSQPVALAALGGPGRDCAPSGEGDEAWPLFT